MPPYCLDNTYFVSVTSIVSPPPPTPALDSQADRVHSRKHHADHPSQVGCCCSPPPAARGRMVAATRQQGRTLL